jgi:serine/threonine protein kinase/Tol biopolymer transport system component
MDSLLQLKQSLSERYDIKREIGAGGMATVYLAQDLRHDRPVALKLLNPELGAVLGPERFLSEIRVTANLQHPNILPLFDSGAADGLLYYVMPYVEGETLRARLNREKQLPVDEAVRMTVAVASALDYAHSHGVIHRDLKPENILLQAGQPVIADFGIALAVSNAGGSRITQTGLSLGTPQYMSPEQATGDRTIDGRSDIYSLGAVAYEMLTGEPPHTGSTSQAIIARMLTENPRPMRTTRPSIPEHVDFAVKHALEKLPADRFSTAHEFAEAIQGRSVAGTTGLYAFNQTGSRKAASTWQSRLRDPITIGLAAIAVGSAGFAAFRKPASREPEKVVRFVLAAADSMKPVQNNPWPAAISPDGGTIVYSPLARPGLFYLRTDQLDPRPIPGTQNATQPHFSPDGQWVAFESNGKLRKVRLDGGAPIAVTDANSENGADWTSKDEIILGSEGTRRGLSRVSAAGGDLDEFVKPDKSKGETDYLWPIASPDGKSVAFAIWTGSLASARLATVSVGGVDVKELGVKGIRPLAIVGRTLIYVQADGLVMALGLNRSFREASGTPVPVLDPVSVLAGTNGNSEIFVSPNGALITSRGGQSSQLAWITRDGTANLVSKDVRIYGAPRLSPDGRRIAVSIVEEGRSDIWINDLSTGTISRLSASKMAGSPAWSPDGSRIYYVGLDDKARYAIWVQSADGGAEAQLVASAGTGGSGLSIAPDGKSLVMGTYTENSWNIVRVSLDTPGVARPFISTSANEVAPEFSPDGKWVAIASDQGGRTEVFIYSYPVPAARVQISAGGGAEPVWSRDGKSVFYRNGAGLLEAKLATTPSMRVVSRDTAIAQLGTVVSGGIVTGYDIGPDGRFIGRSSNRDDYQLVVVPNWRIELEQKLAAARH